MKKKFRLGKMSYDEVSLVDSGADQDADVLLFKRDTTSKALLTPEDVHSPRPLGTWDCAKCGKRHKGKCEDRVSKLTRKQTDQEVSSGPRGSNGGSWQEGKYKRVPAGDPQGGHFAPKNVRSTQSSDGRLMEDEVPSHAPGGAILVDFSGANGGTATYSDGSVLTPAGWIKKGAKWPKIGDPAKAREMSNPHIAGPRHAQVKKAARKNPQMRGHDGRWMSSGSGVKGAGRGYIMVKSINDLADDIDKAWNRNQPRWPKGSGDKSGEWRGIGGLTSRVFAGRETHVPKPSKVPSEGSSTRAVRARITGSDKKPSKRSAPGRGGTGLRLSNQSERIKAMREASRKSGVDLLSDEEYAAIDRLTRQGKLRGLGVEEMERLIDQEVLAHRKRKK